MLGGTLQPGGGTGEARKAETTGSQREEASASGAGADALVELPRALAELPVDSERLLVEAADSSPARRRPGVKAMLWDGESRFEAVPEHRDEEVRELVERAFDSADSDAGWWPFASRGHERGEPLLSADAGAESAGRGCRLALDEFGSGFGSCYYSSTCPCTT
jgi:hypothetical protein